MRPHGFRRSLLLLMTGLLAVSACAPSGGSGSSPTMAQEPTQAPATGGDPTMAASPPGSDSDPSPAALDTDPLHGIQLIDVTSQSPFTLGQLAADGPVLFEMMAIWCTNCRAQQRQVIVAHELADFSSVSVDVDPNERPGDLAQYSTDNGFAWRFAMANQALASSLRDRFGPAVLNPPSTPMILLFPDGSVRALEFRSYDAAELAAEIAGG
jgi:hypothetical protein